MKDLFFKCGICGKTNKVLKDLKFHTSTGCNCTYCEGCKSSLFLFKDVGECKACHTLLHKGCFEELTPFDLVVQLEKETREFVIAFYNKEAGDFKTMRDYDQYLEDVEDIIYNLVNYNDTDDIYKQTVMRIEEYKKKNGADISRRKEEKAMERHKQINEWLQEEVSFERRKVNYEEERNEQRKQQEEEKQKEVEQLFKTIPVKQERVDDNQDAMDQDQPQQQQQQPLQQPNQKPVTYSVREGGGKAGMPMFVKPEQGMQSETYKELPYQQHYEAYASDPAQRQRAIFEAFNSLFLKK